jgi:hypothetical protein
MTLIRARWVVNEGGANFYPDAVSRKLCRSLLKEGEAVVLEIHCTRSGRSHRHAFAELDAAWATLPEHLQGAPWAANPETFRKHLLIVCGFSHSRVVTTSSPVEARHIASVLSQLATEAHGYCICDVRGGVIVLYTPVSMSYRSMNREQFQVVKNALLDAAADLLGVTPESLSGTAN